MQSERKKGSRSSYERPNELGGAREKDPPTGEAYWIGYVCIHQAWNLQTLSSGEACPLTGKMTLTEVHREHVMVVRVHA